MPCGCLLNGCTDEWMNKWVIIWSNATSHFGYCAYYCCCLATRVPLLCNPVDCSPPGSSVHGIFQARILEWVAISPGDLPDPGIERAASLLLSQKVMLCRMCTYSQCCILLLAWPLYHCVALLSLITVLKSVYDIKRPSNPSFLLVSVCMDYLSFRFQSVYVLTSEMSLP